MDESKNHKLLGGRGDNRTIGLLNLTAMFVDRIHRESGTLFR